MIFENPYWSDKVKIQMLQRWILVHSFLYYELDSPVVSDHMFDNNCKQLYGFKKKHPKSYQRAKYTYAMKDFDGSTGFGFVEKLNKADYDVVFRDAHNVKDHIIRKQ